MQEEPRKSSRRTPGPEGLVDDIGLDHQVLVDEVGRIAVVGEDAADLGGGEDHHVGPFGLQEGADVGLAGKIERLAVAGDDGGTAAFQLAQDGAAHHAPVAGEEDAHPP